MALSTNDFNFELPEELIAQTPLKDRSSSKLLVLNAETGEVEDKNFTDIINYLNSGDVLVVNNSRVLPARLHGHRPETLGHAEVLLLNQQNDDEWEVLIKPARKYPVGSEIYFGVDAKNPLLKAKVIKELEHGGRIVKFEYQGIFLEILNQLGEMPLPPYIKERLEDQERYQTVYSKVNGSAAAPTAGLHWTPDLLEKVKEKGVEIVELTLHVGLGTFRPVDVEDVNEHVMHSEFYQLSKDAADTLNKVKKNGGRVIATGTTSIRTLETIGTKFNGKLKEDSGWTEIFIFPGYKWKIVDAFITNFHLPKSTLVMLVAAFTGKENILNAYKHAIKMQYRFFSFGDAMYVYRK